MPVMLEHPCRNLDLCSPQVDCVLAQLQQYVVCNVCSFVDICKGQIGEVQRLDVPVGVGKVHLDVLGECCGLLGADALPDEHLQAERSGRQR